MSKLLSPKSLKLDPDGELIVTVEDLCCMFKAVRAWASYVQPDYAYLTFIMGEPATLLALYSESDTIEKFHRLLDEGWEVCKQHSKAHLS